MSSLCQPLLQQPRCAQLRPLQTGAVRLFPRFGGVGISSRRAVKQRATGEKQKTVENEAQVDAEWAQEVLKEIVDSPELGRRGEAWFAAQLVALLLVAFPPGQLRPLLDAAGWLGIVGGLGMAVAGQQVLGRRLTPLPKPREGSSLVTSGIYAYCRHPMYGGLVLASAGLGLALSDDLRVALAALVFLILDRKASYEEELLEEQFGAEYVEYKKKTKKLLPYIY
ncbi:hypothetical protein ABPG77_006747 [Micractinium sp. CCAP 211/92]